MNLRPLIALLGMDLSCVAVFAQQGFYREYYAGISGTAVPALTNAAAFPNSPTTEDVINNVLETGTNIDDYYGQRLRALLTPTVTGNYTFWIASDDQSELWLGTNSLPASRRRIAYVSGWTNPRVWTSSVYQCSAAISLTAGTRYYIEALHKENSGGDNLSVAWLVPGSGVTNVIPAEVMQPYLETPAVKTQPASVNIFAQWAGLQNVAFSVEAVRKGGLFYQWQEDGTDLAGATQSTYTCLADLANSNRLFRCRLYSLGGAVTSQTARYSFVPDTIPPSLTQWSLSHDRRSLALSFSEPLLAASITNGAFAIASNAVLRATLADTTTNVVLRLTDSLAAGTAYTLSLAVSDCASPVNVLSTNLVFTPPALAPVPLALLRGGTEPPGPSTRRSPLAVTEINHTPAARADGSDLRFVELYNSNPFYQDIGGYSLSGAFDYTVPTGTVLAANGYLVVAPVPADIAAVYGATNVVGGFTSKAFDGSSTVTLKDELGAWITSVSYSDDPPWPTAADGSGHTLVLARPSYGEDYPDGWSASAYPGGSPGGPEPTAPGTYAAVVFNELLTCSGTNQPGFVELHNLFTSAVSLAGCVVKHGKPASTGYAIPDGTVLPSGGCLAFDEATLGFKINGGGDTLWLFAPASAGNAVVDVVRFNNQEAGVAYGRYPDGDAAWNRLETPSAGQPNTPRRTAEVVLNEIMYHPISGSKNEEYVELFNPGTNAVDLAGWKLGGDISYTFSQTIAAKGYLVVPRDRDTLAALYPAQESLMTDSYGGSLDNSRGTVTLSKPVIVMDTDSEAAPVADTKNTVIETVTYRDGGEWSSLADGGGSSLERIDPRADPSLARSWAASDESQKSAWTTLSFTGTIDQGFSTTNGDPNAVNVGLMDAGECLVDSVSVSTNNGANLVCNPSFESDTSDWRFMGTHNHSSIETNAAAPDGNRVLHVRATDRCHNGMNIIRGLMSTNLVKTGTGTISVRARWLAGCPELLVRTRGSWIETCGTILTTRALGTPGMANSRAAANAAPALFDVTHDPVLPRNGEAVTVYARASDPDGVLACTLHYRIDGYAGSYAVAMRPAAGGRFAGEIPAGQITNTLVAFYVEAVDASGTNTLARFPAAAPTRECLARYNEPLDSRSFGIYRFWVTQSNVAYWAAREKASNEPVDATFVYGTNRVLYGAGVLYAGSPFHSGYTTPIIPSGNIDYEAVFQADDTLLGDDGVVLSTIGNLGSDTNGVREQFCYSLVHANHIPHMYRRFIHLYANGAEQNNSKKIYEDTEKPNSGAIKHWFPDDTDGDFFKIDDWFEYNLGLTAFDYTTARLQRYATTNSQGQASLKLGRYRWNWLKRGYDTFHANDDTNFFTLVETLNLADTNAYLSAVQSAINLNDSIPVFVVNQFIGNFDSYGFSRGKNMFLYDGAKGWQFIAWDLDYNFGMSRPLTDPINPTLASFITEDPAMRTLLKTPLAARIFWRAVAKTAAAAQNTEVRAFTRAKYDALKADNANLTGTFDGFMDIVDARAANVLAQLAAAQASGFSVTSPTSTVSTATNTVVALTGTAPFGVTSVLVNGVAVPITWVTASNWTAQVVLNNGTNLFTVTGLDETGAAVSNDTVNLSIAYAGTALDPLAGYLVFSEIMHSPATNGAAYIELQNLSSNTVMNLSGLVLTGAVSFTFPNGLVIAPSTQLVVAANSSAFLAAYGTSLAPRVTGCYTGTLPSAGGRLLLKRPATGFEIDDDVIDDVAYESAYPWPTGAVAGTSLQLVNPVFDNNRVANWTANTNQTKTAVLNPIPWNATWKYDQSGDPGVGWTNVTFDDSAWLSGPGVHAYETSTTLPLPVGTTLTLTSGRITYYFRTTFTFAGNPANAALALSYMVDDAAIFYLNGQELCRSSLMPAGTITDTTVASTAKTPEGQIEGPFAVPATALRAGVNTLAVGVHQNQGASSDLVFGMSLTVTATLANASSPAASNAVNATLSALPGVWLNEVQSLNATGPTNNLGAFAPWVELYNADTSSVSLAGWSLATSADDPGWFFPSNTALAPRSFLRAWLDGQTNQTAAGHLHAGLRFAVTNGLLVLRATIDGRTAPVDYLRVTNATADAVWGTYPDGTSNPRRWLNPATPAASNRVDKPACRVVINEFMAQNDLYTNPLSGKKDDWFELFNDGTGTVSLAGYIVTDTLVSETPPKPDTRSSKSLVVSNGVSLAAGAALRLWTGASKSTTLAFDPANLQAPFGLDKDGDQICLFNAATQLVDRVVFTNAPPGTASIGRWVNGADGDLVTFSSPTPGAPNRNPRFAAVVAQPPAFAIPEERPFGYTNTFAAARPANFVFRLHPTTGCPVPTNLLLDTASGALAWTPSEAQGPGFYPLRLCGFITNALSATACDDVLLTLSVDEVNSPLAYKSPTAFYLWHGEPLDLRLSYEDLDLPSNHLQFALLAGPSGMRLDSETARLQWQPADSQTGAFACTVRGTDNAGSTVDTAIAFYVDTAQLAASGLAASTSGGLALKWSSKPDTTYVVQRSASLDNPDWQPLNADAPLSGTGSALTYTISPTSFGSASNAFFRIIQTRE